MESKSNMEETIKTTLKRLEAESESIATQRRWSFSDHNKNAVLRVKIEVLSQLTQAIPADDGHDPRHKLVDNLPMLLRALNYKSAAFCGTPEVREIISELFKIYCPECALPKFPGRWDEAEVIENQVFMDGIGEQIKEGIELKKIENKTKDASSSLESHQAFKDNAHLLILNYRHQLVNRLISSCRTTNLKRSKATAYQKEIDQINAKIKFIDEKFVNFTNFDAFREFVPTHFHPGAGVAANLFKEPCSMEPLVLKLALHFQQRGQHMYEPNPVLSEDDKNLVATEILDIKQFQAVCELRTKLQAESDKGWANKGDLSRLLRKDVKIQTLNDILKCNTVDELKSVRAKANDLGALEGNPSRVEELLSKLERAHGIDHQAERGMHK